MTDRDPDVLQVGEVLATDESLAPPEPAQDVVANGEPEKSAELPQKAEPKGDGRSKPKGRDEAAKASVQKAGDALSPLPAASQQPEAAPQVVQPSRPKSLAAVMKVDLRVRGRRHY